MSVDESDANSEQSLELTATLGWYERQAVLMDAKNESRMLVRLYGSLCAAFGDCEGMPRTTPP